MSLNRSQIEVNNLPLKKDWVLTQKAFDQLLARLDRDRERAAERYEDLREMITTFFEFRGSLAPEEQADETLNRVARRITEGQEIMDRSIETYVYAVARNVWREHLAQPQRLIAVDDLTNHQLGRQNSDERATPADAQEVLERRLECLESCLQTLSPEHRALIMSYYQGEGKAKIQNRKRLADEMGMPINALRIRASRLRDRLQACVKHCLKKLQIKRN